jgi:hypothetical protein
MRNAKNSIHKKFMDTLKMEDLVFFIIERDII